MASLEAFLAHNPDVAEIRLTRVRGSAPRATGTVMYVSPQGVCGTIGGGQLEYMAIDEARAMINTGDAHRGMDVPLGPEIGQCCGGRVEIEIQILDAAAKQRAISQAEQVASAQPSVLVFGAGHVGRALAAQLALMPVRCLLIDSRPEELDLNTAPVETRLSALPEAEVRAAPPGSAFVIATHDHSLDFLVAAEALSRADTAYVGMIGSRTKRASFRSWARRQNGLPIDHLICPIGAGGSRDKRPSVIAALVAAEVITALTSETAALSPSLGG